MKIYVEEDDSHENGFRIGKNIDEYHKVLKYKKRKNELNSRKKLTSVESPYPEPHSKSTSEHKHSNEPPKSNIKSTPFSYKSLHLPCKGHTSIFNHRTNHTPFNKTYRSGYG